MHISQYFENIIRPNHFPEGWYISSKFFWANIPRVNVVNHCVTVCIMFFLYFWTHHNNVINIHCKNPYSRLMDRTIHTHGICSYQANWKSIVFLLNIPKNQDAYMRCLNDVIICSQRVTNDYINKCHLTIISSTKQNCKDIVSLRKYIDHTSVTVCLIIKATCPHTRHSNKERLVSAPPLNAPIHMRKIIGIAFP